MKFLGNCRWFGLPLAPLVMGASLWIFQPTAVAAAATNDASAAPHSTGQGRKKKSRTSGKRKTAKRHRRKRSQPAPVVAAPAPPAAPVVALSPGPLQTPEARKAMEQVRRGQLERAESAARRAELTNRWETVSFLLSGVEDG